jgi:hypothetical protein
MKFIQLFTYFFVFTTASIYQVNAELVLVKSEKGQMAPINYEQSSPEQKAEMDKIYEELLMVYQWPMIQVEYPLMKEADKAEVDKALTQDFGLVTLVNQKLNTHFGEKYQVIYTPATLFEMGVIINIANQHIHPKHQKQPGVESIFPKGDMRNAQYVRDVPELFSENLIAAFPPTGHAAPKDHARFLNKTYGVYNLKPEIKELYFLTCDTLFRKFKQKVNQSGQISFIANQLMQEFMSIADAFQNAISNTNPYIQPKANGMLNFTYLSVLIKAANAQFQADQKGQFLLFRGSGGIELNEDVTLSEDPSSSFGASESISVKGQKAWDIPSRDLKNDYESATQGRKEREKYISLRTGIHAPTKLRGGGSADKKFTPASLSFGNSALAGTFYDSNSTGQGNPGARALDFMMGKDDGYYLSFSIKNFLETPPLKVLYMVSPFNTVMGVLGSGEFFHSRSKFSILKAGFAWSGYVTGITSFYKVDSSHDKDISLGFGFVSLPHMEWPLLSAQISKDMSKHMHIIAKADKAVDSLQREKDQQELQKKLGRFQKFCLKLTNILLC